MTYMRILHKLYARLMGYFWLPCPVCGRLFGGHEISNIFTAALIADNGRAYCVCADPQCSYEAGVKNAANGHAQVVRSNPISSTENGANKKGVGAWHNDT